MKSATTAILFDLDSTLAHTEHRHHLIPLIRKGEATWEDYAALCDADTPMLGTLAVMREFWPYHQIHIVSGRSDSARDKTVAWFARHRFDGFYDYLSLCRGDQFDCNSSMKIAYIRSLQEQDIKPLVFFEDHLPVGRSITDATGVPVVLVNPAYEWVEAEKARRVG